jgi:hypothetical protein
MHLFLPLQSMLLLLQFVTHSTTQCMDALHSHEHIATWPQAKFAALKHEALQPGFDG